MALMSILGHSSLNMVLEYVEMYGDDLKVNFNECNPLADFAEGERVTMRR